MATQLFPYQREGVLAINNFGGRALLADEMGLGKTIQALSWMKRQPLVQLAIVVCPAGLKYNWLREAAKHVDIQAEILTGKTPPSRQQLQHQRLYIINYDILHYWLPYLVAMAPDLVIIDECHAIKNRGSQRYKAVKYLTEDVPYLIAISGTPLTNRPAEVWPILNLLRPDVWPSFFSFGVRHCRPRKRRWGWEYKGADHLDELHTNMREHVMVRRLKRDVLKELPAKSRYVTVLDIEDRHQYDEALHNFGRWLGTKHPSKMNAALRAQALVQVGYLKRLAGTLKLRNTIQWVEQFLGETDEKLIVFGVHQAVLKPLHQRFGDLGVLVDGSTQPKQRQINVDKFTHDKHTRLFFGNIQAAGTGWNGTAASTVAFAELSWIPGDHTQAEARPDRIGQKQAVSCYYLVAHGTVEEKLCALIQEKQANLDAVLDGNPETTQLQIFDELLNQLRFRR